MLNLGDSVDRRAIVVRRLSFLALTLVATCTPAKRRDASSSSASPSASTPYVKTAVAPSSSGPRLNPPAPSSSAQGVVHRYDAGTNECRLVYGPAQQPFLGEVALLPTDTGVLLVTHHDGVPTVTRVVANVDAAAAPSERDAGLPTVTSPPCAIAGAFSFCMDPGGVIHRRVLEGEGRDVVVAHGRPGTAFAAEVIDSGHVVVAFLAERHTTEGMVSEAYAVLDSGSPLRLSDDGSGSTHLALARRGGSLLVMLIDGRVAMTPVHARTLGLAQGKLVLGEDAVVFVGGEAEQSTRGALGVAADGAAYALIPIAGESGFGLASVHLDDPPRVEEPVVWSTYLNGLDPAPIAATDGTTPVRVARVRPLEAKYDGPRGLELGRLDDKGAFVSYGLVGSKGRVKSAAIAMDRAGMLWLAFTDGAGTWLERRACP